MTRYFNKEKKMASFSKRHFEFVASVLKDAGPGLEQSDFNFLVELFANEFAETNERFDKDRFVNACWEQDN